MCLMVLAWSACEPCENESLATFIPASINARNVSGVLLAGPMVQTIFVRLRCVMLSSFLFFTNQDFTKLDVDYIMLNKNRH